MPGRWINRCAFPSVAPTGNTRIAGATPCRSSPYESAHEPQTATAQAPSTQQAYQLIALVLLIASGVVVAWWLPLVLAVLGWIAHEAWFADHLFYSPKDDYQYSFPPYTPQPKVHLNGEHLRLDDGVMLVDDATLVLALRVESTWLGRFIDPVVELSGGDNPTGKRSSVGSMVCAIST
jgi:hypothetical protein